MNDDEVWAAIDSQRRRTADLLEQLSDDEWLHPSLCEGWTVRDVAAHLTLQQVGLGEAIVSVITHPSILGGINRMIHKTARIRADLPTQQLIAQIRAMIGSRRHNLGVTSLDTLTDILVHSQDIAIPLRRDLDMPTEASAAAATRVWSQLGKATSRVFHDVPLHGSRLTATDISWSVGEGREITGPIGAILLLLTGRLAALPQLSGDGAQALRKELPRRIGR
jgi:uncharacterized protein (TIGR03083 family)